VYKFDKPHEIALLYKVTNRHLNSVAQSAMKFKLAVRVMSHTAAASLYSLVSAGKKYYTAFIYHVLLKKQ
jgi:hypothetical protein